jgi:hypothetical protein
MRSKGDSHGDTGAGKLFGTIQSVSGKATIVAVDGSVRPVIAGGKVFQNEMILTSANAAVKLQLADGKLVDIAGGSEHQIGVDAAPGAGGADEGGGGTAATTGQADGRGAVTGGVGTEGAGVGRVIGTVTNGEVKVTSPDGSVRTLGSGDKVFANETVIPTGGAPVNISLASGGSLECAPGAELTLSTALLQVGKPAGISSIQDAILAGADPTQVTDPTAAGAPAAGGSDEGAGGSHVAVVIEQANGKVDPTAGFATSLSAGPGFPTFYFELLPRGVTPPVASLVGPSGPGVLEGTNGGTPHTILFTIELSKAVTVAVGVNYLILPPASDGNGPDLAGALAGTAIIQAGQTSATIEISIVQDHFVELNEQVTIQLTNAINATVNPVANSATITIVDDDLPPLAVNDAFTINEGQVLAGNVLPNDSLAGARGPGRGQHGYAHEPQRRHRAAQCRRQLHVHASRPQLQRHRFVQLHHSRSAARRADQRAVERDGVDQYPAGERRAGAPAGRRNRNRVRRGPADRHASGDPNLLHTQGTFHILDLDADEIKLATIQYSPSGDAGS